MKFILTAITAGALAFVQVPLPSYSVYDLGTFGTGNISYGFGINNAGWVTGSSNLVPNGPQHAFIWYGSHTLNGPTVPGAVIQRAIRVFPAGGIHQHH